MKKRDFQAYLAEYVMIEKEHILRARVEKLYEAAYEAGGLLLAKEVVGHIIGELHRGQATLKHNVSYAYTCGETEYSDDLIDTLRMSEEECESLFGESSVQVHRPITTPLLTDVLRIVCRAYSELNDKKEEEAYYKRFERIPSLKNTTEVEVSNSHTVNPSGVVQLGNQTLRSSLLSEVRQNPYEPEKHRPSVQNELKADELVSGSRSTAQNEVKSLQDLFVNPDDFEPYMKLLLKNDGEFKLVAEDGSWLKDHGSLTVVGGWICVLKERNKIQKVSREKLVTLFKMHFKEFKAADDGRALFNKKKTFYKYYDFFKGTKLP